MAKATTVKCKFCHKAIEKAQAYSVVERSYYCSQEHYQMHENKKKYKPTKSKANGEENDRRALTDWIQNYYIREGWDKHDINWKLITAHLKNIMEDGEFKYMGIILTLEYLTEEKGMNLLNNESGSILGLVPMNYLPAKQNYLEKCARRKAMQEFEFSTEPRVITKKNKGHTYNIDTTF